MKNTLKLLAAAVFILAGCGKAVNGPLGPSSSSTAGVTQQVGTAGGTVSAGVVSVNIPAGALAANVNISVVPVTEGSLPASAPAGKAFVSAAVFGPDGTTFSTPVTITFSLKEPAAAGSTLPFYVYNVAHGSWESNGVATVSANGLTASASVTHFSTYSVMKANGLTAEAKLHNHYIWWTTMYYTGYFDFASGVELAGSTGPFTTGDFSFKANTQTDVLLTGDDGATGGIQELLTASLESVTSVPTTGYGPGIDFNGKQASTLVNKVFAVKTTEGNYVALQITEVEGSAQPQWIKFKWKVVQ